MDVIIKIFNANDIDNIDEADGDLKGLGYDVTRLHADKGLSSVDETLTPSSRKSFDDVVLLVAKFGAEG